MRTTLFAVALICGICSWCRGAEPQASPQAPPSDAKAPSQAVEKPPLAVSPFDAAQAKKHQGQWAKHLGVPVELTNSIGMKLALIPAGEFLMGSPETEQNRDADAPQHPVRITKPFYLGVYEVTQTEYERVMGTNPSWYSWGGGGKEQVVGMDTARFPVEMVTWKDTVEFCRKLSALVEERIASRQYRLPTEAEWEYACRAGTTTRFYFGARFDYHEMNVGSPYENVLERELFPGRMTLGRTTRVGSYRPNAFGLYDMHGNVCEWCLDWYGANYYKESPVDDPQGPSHAATRVCRGDDWRSGPEECGVARRKRDGFRDHRSSNVGFRVAFAAPGK